MIKDNYIVFKYGILSDYYESEFMMEGIHFYSAKAAYSYLKAKFFNDQRMLSLIPNERDPRTSENLGNCVMPFNEEDWSKVRYKCIVYVLKHKFWQNLMAREALLETEDKIIIYSNKNKYFGITNFDESLDLSELKGENQLGRALMEVRDWIIEKLK